MEMITTEFVQKMEASLVAGTWGDASICNNGVQAKFQDAGYHLDMTDRLKSDGINLQTDWSLMGLEIWEGKALMLPFDNDPRAVYYNKTAFKEAGIKDPWDDHKGNWTWDDMVDAARKLTKKDAAGKTTRYGLQWNYTSYQEFSPFVWSMGGNYANWETLKYTLDDPQVLKTHQMLYDWAKKDKFLITKEGITEMMGAGGPNPFRAGVTAMFHRAAYEWNIMKDAIADKWEWDAAPFPDVSANTRGAPVTSGNPNFVPKATKLADEGYEWIKWLAGEEVQSYFGEKRVLVPSNKKAWKHYLKNPEGRHPEAFIRYVYGRQHGFHFYNFGMGPAGTAIDSQLDLVYLDKKPLEAALKDAHKEANELVNFGKAQKPFAFTVPKPPEPDLSKWGIEPLK
jgi:multiple sugar transport system substrate-binding protein